MVGKCWISQWFDRCLRIQLKEGSHDAKLVASAWNGLLLKRVCLTRLLEIRRAIDQLGFFVRSSLSSLRVINKLCRNKPTTMQSLPFPKSSRGNMPDYAMTLALNLLRGFLHLKEKKYIIILSLLPYIHKSEIFGYLPALMYCIQPLRPSIQTFPSHYCSETFVSRISILWNIERDHIEKIFAVSFPLSNVIANLSNAYPTLLNVSICVRHS